MVALDDLFDPGKLGAYIANKYVVERLHPELPLAIYNYTDHCTYDRLWDEVTVQCRGLIATLDGEVISRPFRKFFNYGEPDAPTFDLDEAVITYDKLDGSLGIYWEVGGQRGVATRGSFDSQQARHATLWWHEHCQDVEVPEGCTPLFEIVYPANRVVLNYGDRDELVLLGLVHNETGKSTYDDRWWGRSVAPQFGYKTLADALEAKPRPNAEGIVVYFPATDERVKLKQEDYVALHRIIYGLNARVVWQHLREGRHPRELIEPLPDELHRWVKDQIVDLGRRRMLLQHEAANSYWTSFAGIRGSARDVATDPKLRKRFAENATRTPHAAYCFAMLDGNEEKASDWIWDQIKPRGDVRPEGRELSEDTA